MWVLYKCLLFSRQNIYLIWEKEIICNYNLEEHAILKKRKNGELKVKKVVFLCRLSSYGKIFKHK